jgi:hypothetical protein
MAVGLDAGRVEEGTEGIPLAQNVSECTKLVCGGEMKLNFFCVF